MRVVTWNVWGCFGPWQDRAPRLMEPLDKLRPDIVCLQETWATHDTGQADDLAAQLGLQAVFSRSRMPEPTPAPDAVVLGLAILGRWPVLEYRRERLPDGTDGRLPAKDPSVALVVTFDHPAGPLHVVTACPDWDADRSLARLSQTQALAALLTDPALNGTLPVILAADLNSRPGTPEFQALAGVLVDTWAAARPGQPGYTFTTNNSFVGSHEWLADGRIDHILARSGTPGHPLTVRAAALAGTNEPAPSDHYAVVADLEW
jgi:endonuclease/exonuclease/phosphatase family metal-dependent hydrolase